MDDRQFGEGLEKQKKTQPEEKKGSSAPAGKMVWREPGDKPVEMPPGKQKEPGKHKKVKIICLIAVLGVLAVGFGLYAARANYYQDRFLEGTVINQMDCSGMTVEQVESMLAEQVEGYAIELTFRDGQTETLSGDAIGYQYVSDGSVQAIKDSQNPWLWIQGYFQENESSAEVTTGYDETLLQEQLYGLPEMQEESMTAPTDAYVDYQNGTFLVVAETYGNTLNRETVLNAVKQAVSENRTELNVEEVEGAYAAPSVTQADETLTQRAQELNNLISSSITYILPTGSQVLNSETLVTWLCRDENGHYYKDDTVWNQNITQYVANLAAAVDTVGTDRQFSATGLGTITVGGGVYGWQIDQDSEVAQLTQELENQTVTEREPVYSSREVSTENNGFGNSYVEIDLSRQHLWLYQNGQLMVESDIVSGTMTEDRYTPPGIFQMYYKQRDKVLKGEIQEDGEPEYEQPVSFWMPFNGGIGLHDATWNSSFGGDKYIYSGSHGCINLPYDIAEQIYNIIDTEMPIICYYSQPYTLHD